MTYKNTPVTILQQKCSLSQIIYDGQEDCDAIWVLTSLLKKNKSPRSDDHRSYLTKLPDEFVQTETAVFLDFAGMLVTDPKALLTCSVTELLNPGFAEEYATRSGRSL